ncbi:MAG TPA: DUF2231 domain-containing protein [Terriglobia bacterium]|nr:DUF2231 domain-containing protein [Terriglobia bacterium]
MPIIPGWDGLHPLIIHFPIALLFTVPLFVILGAVFSPPWGRAFLLSALILMVLGTASIFLAVETGQAAGESARSRPAIQAAIDQHRDLAESTEVLFSVLTFAFAALLFVPKWIRAELIRTVNVALLAVFLIFYATGILFLVNTAHLGGMLVHAMGVKSNVTPGASALVCPGH